MSDGNAASGSTGGRTRTGVRRLPLRTMLLVIVLVPSMALAPMWGMGTYQLVTRWHAEKTQADLAAAVSGPATLLGLSLGTERDFTADAQADGGASSRDKLTKQRAETDQAVSAFRPLAALDTSDGQRGLAGAIAGTDHILDLLTQQRRAVDTGSSSTQKAFEYYSDGIDAIQGVFSALSHSDNADVAAMSQPLVDLLASIDMIGREDAVLSRGWKTGHLTSEEYNLLVDAIGTGKYLLDSQVAPELTDQESDHYRALTTSEAWKTKTALEDRLVTAGIGAGSNQAALPDISAEWRSSLDVVMPQLLGLVQLRSEDTAKVAAATVDRIFAVLLTVSAVVLLAISMIIFTSWRLTSILRRRIFDLLEDAQELQKRLPDVVARLGRGEEVDVDAEVRLVDPTPDELGELGQALNLASRSAVSAAVRQAEQHRGFERMLQRIARRTQILIGLQLKKLDELERQHEDPEVLDGLFDLDHLTARLRRYEENLVILGGGQPQRRWRKPVRLLDVLRAAQGEVQDYRRISIDVEDEPWVGERAVGPLIHILAELMENAAAFSKPPTPVEVRAALVGRGIAVEIEDRGLGMEPEQYAAANALMQSPPQLDVMTHADDVRLGLYVVARLSVGLGLRVELRPSAFGGTRVIVLLPEHLVVDRPRVGRGSAALPDEVPQEPTGPRPHPREATFDPRPFHEDGQLPTRSRGRAMAHVTASAAGSPDPGGESLPSDPQPLPQRVRQASLVSELRLPDTEDQTDRETWAVRDQPGRSGATIGAFQRQSRRARTADDTFQPGPNGTPAPGSAKKEDRR